jgi:diaminobutyrate-2-oxoglutarate transaminase
MRRIYVDGVWDLLHYGHLEHLEKAKACGDLLIVGVMGDLKMQQDPDGEKRLPIATMEERARALRHVKWVDEIVLDPPYPNEINEAFLQKHRIDLVVHAINDDQLWKLETDYRYLRAAGVFKRLERSGDISTTELITRVCNSLVLQPPSPHDEGEEAPSRASAVRNACGEDDSAPVPGSESSREEVTDETMDVETFVASYENPMKSYALKYKHVFTAASGACVYDAVGNEYQDCLQGFGVTPLGHMPEPVRERLAQMAKAPVPPLMAALDLATPERMAFMRAARDLFPTELKEHRFLFCGPTGSEAAEAAIQIARRATGRKTIVAFQGCYHGDTALLRTVSGNPCPVECPHSADVIHAFFPREKADDCPFGVGGVESVRLSLTSLARLLDDPKGGKTAPAAIIIEPVQSDAGFIPAPAEFLLGLSEIAKKRGIVYIVDEVQTAGFKTGPLFGYERAAGVVPDVLVCSKSWAAGLPLAFVLYSPNLGLHPHLGTFRGNQMAFVLGEALMRHAASFDVALEVSRIETLWLAAKAQLMKCTTVRDVRVVGLLLGVETISESVAESAFQKLLDRKILCKVGGRHQRTLIFWLCTPTSNEQCTYVRESLLEAL